jgi:hypothetical protein
MGGCGQAPDGTPPKTGASSGGKGKPATNQQKGPGANAIRVTGEKLAADYKANSAEAEKKYDGKLLEVEAVVETVYLNDGQVTFKGAPEMALQCMDFGPDVLKTHPEIATGKTVKFHAKVGTVTSRVVNLKQPKLITSNPGK